MQNLIYKEVDIMLTTTRQISDTAENVLCYFGYTLVVQFTHTKAGNMHTFERTNYQFVSDYPLYLSEHHAMMQAIFSKSYTANDISLIYQAIDKDYKRLITEAYKAIDMGRF
jgi:hypothetical protein